MALTGIDLQTQPFNEGRVYAGTGAYEEMKGTARVALDPAHPLNAVITDLDLAPKGDDGRVHFDADVSIVRPVEAAKRSRMLLLDVVNRGNPILRSLGGSDWADEWLMAQGFTIVRCGWQHDVGRNGRFGIDLVEALNPDGSRIRGKVSRVFEPDDPVSTFPLGEDAVLYTAADVNDAEATLWERDHALAPPRVIPRDQWCFGRPDPEKGEAVVTDVGHVFYAAGFTPGKFYECIYTAEGAPLTGAGLAGLRDVVSYLRFSGDDANPCRGEIDQAIAFGVSQSGRTLRTLLYYGLCEDEEGRLVFEGLLPHTGGARLLETNWRFGQPSYNGWDSMAAVFPFCDEPQLDPVTGERDGLMLRAIERDKLPKVLYTNTSAEYWGGQIGGMAHVAADGGSDAPMPANVRYYHFAGTQHGAGTLDGGGGRANPRGPRSAYPANSIDYRPLLRAAFANFIAWVRDGVEPPPSAYGHIADGTLAERESLRPDLAMLPGPGLPTVLADFYYLDFGAEAKKLGRTEKLPPEIGQLHRSWVSAVDGDGNEVAGVRHPDIAAPLATFTGWNPRHPGIGGAEQNLRTAGATIAFAKTAADAAPGDSRAPIAARYASREDYVAKVRAAAGDLVARRLMLADEVEAVVENADRRWDLYLGG